MKTTSHDTTRYEDKRSLTQTLLETLSEGGLRPKFSESSRGGRTRNRRIAGSAVFVLAVVALGVTLLRSSLPDLNEPVAYLELARGSVEVTPGSGEPGSRFASIGAAPQAIYAGSVLETRAADRAALRLGSGPSVRLDRDSRVRFASTSAVVLERGAVYVDSALGSSVEVRTSLGVVRDVGTQFEVRLQPSEGEETLRVRVREGSIYLKRGDGDVHTATVGEELEMDGDGSLGRGLHPVHGPEWEWVLDTAAVPDVSGRPLREFLDRVAREGGWELRFAGETTAERSAATVVHGNVGGLSLRQAIDTVLQGAGLDYRIEDGALIVAGRTDA